MSLYQNFDEAFHRWFREATESMHDDRVDAFAFGMNQQPGRSTRVKRAARDAKHLIVEDAEFVDLLPESRRLTDTLKGE